jgi:hypothetical protein
MRYKIAVLLMVGVTPLEAGRAQTTDARRPAQAAGPAAGGRAPAPTEPARASSTRTNTSFGLKLGTGGVSAELSRLLGNHVGVRAVASFVRYEYSDQSIQIANRIDSDLTFESNAVSALLDVYPGSRGVFRFSVGAMTTPMKYSGVGRLLNDTPLRVANRDYPQPRQTVGDFIYNTSFANVVPYAGIGFGTPASPRRRMGFVMDLGLAIGKPTFTATTTMAATTTSPTLRSDLAMEQADTQRDVYDKFPGWPVLSLGVAYRF